MRIASRFLIAVPVAMLAVAGTASAAAAPPTGITGSLTTGVHFVAMEPLDVPIVEGDRAQGRLRIRLVLQTADAEGVARIDARLPVLREIVLANAIEFARLYASPSAPVDAQRLAAGLSAALRHADGAIVAVLVVEIAARRA